MIRIIDNKKIDLTNEEFQMYQDICRSYDRPNFKGEELFKEHFNTNNDGIIIFVRPPQKRFTSMEVFCFLISIMVNQHLRIGQDQINKLVEEARTKITELVESAKKD